MKGFKRLQVEHATMRIALKSSAYRSARLHGMGSGLLAYEPMDRACRQVIRYIEQPEYGYSTRLSGTSAPCLVLFSRRREGVSLSLSGHNPPAWSLRTPDDQTLFSHTLWEDHGGFLGGASMVAWQVGPTMVLLRGRRDSGKPPGRPPACAFTLTPSCVSRGKSMKYRPDVQESCGDVSMGYLNREHQAMLYVLPKAARHPAPKSCRRLVHMDPAPNGLYIPCRQD